MPVSSLRLTVLRSGGYLAARQGAGTLIGVVGVLLLTRIIGPADYGLYAAASGVFIVLQLIAQLGINIFLIRRDTEVDDSVADTAATLLLVLGVVAAAIGIALTPLITSWTRLAGLTPVAWLLMAGLPLSQLTQVPLARLERALDYRRVAWIELVAQTSFFAVGVLLALMGAGVWAMVAGWWTQQILQFALLYRAVRRLPRFRWDPAVVRAAVAYGIGYTASIWLHQLRRLVNPLVVGRYLGAEAVAIVALSAQVATHLSFAAIAAFRLATAALARVQDSADKLRSAITEGMQLSVLAVAPFLLAFAWLAPWIVTPVLGSAWSRLPEIFPYIAAAQLVACVFNLHSSALYVLQRNWDMARYHVVHTGLLALAALLLVPKVGLVGYGVAELATIAGFVVLHAYTRKRVGTPRYAAPLALTGAVILALFWFQLGPASLLALVIVVPIYRPWKVAREAISVLRGATA